MRVLDNSAVKGTSGMDKYGSVVDRMNIKLGSKFLNSLKIKTQLHKRLQREIVVDGVESNGGSFKDGAEAAICAFLRGVQLFCDLVSSLYLTSMRWM